MGIEIERKFLIVGDGWRSEATRSVGMRQGYLAASAGCSVRVRLEGGAARLNIKSATLGVERREFEYTIPVDDARVMLDTLCGGKSLSKTRHFVPHAGHVWEVDEFDAPNAPLAVAEIELASVDEAFEKPPWVGAEVSGDPRYYNVCLIDHPYSSW